MQRRGAELADNGLPSDQGGPNTRAKTWVDWMKSPCSMDSVICRSLDSTGTHTLILCNCSMRGFIRRCIHPSLDCFVQSKSMWWQQEAECHAPFAQSHQKAQFYNFKMKERVITEVSNECRYQNLFTSPPRASCSLQQLQPRIEIW